MTNEKTTAPETIIQILGATNQVVTREVLGQDHITVWYNLDTAGSIFVRWGPNATDLCEAGSFQDDGTGVGSVHLNTNETGLINTIQVAGSCLATGSLTAYLITQD